MTIMTTCVWSPLETLYNRWWIHLEIHHHFRVYLKLFSVSLFLNILNAQCQDCHNVWPVCVWELREPAPITWSQWGVMSEDLTSGSGSKYSSISPHIPLLFQLLQGRTECWKQRQVPTPPHTHTRTHPHAQTHKHMHIVNCPNKEDKH